MDVWMSTNAFFWCNVKNVSTFKDLAHYWYSIVILTNPKEIILEQLLFLLQYKVQMFIILSWHTVGTQ